MTAPYAPERAFAQECAQELRQEIAQGKAKLLAAELQDRLHERDQALDEASSKQPWEPKILLKCGCLWYHGTWVVSCRAHREE